MTDEMMNLCTRAQRRARHARVGSRRNISSGSAFAIERTVLDLRAGRTRMLTTCPSRLPDSFRLSAPRATDACAVPADVVQPRAAPPRRHASPVVESGDADVRADSASPSYV